MKLVPIVLTYLTLGVFVGATVAWNLWKNSTGSKSLILFACLCVWLGATLLWPAVLYARHQLNKE